MDTDLCGTTKSRGAGGALAAGVRRRSLLRAIYRDRYLYLLFMPIFLIYFVVFRYLPMYGVTIAFKDFRLIDGIFGSQWIGLRHFERLFRSPEFVLIVRNTLLLNMYQLAFQFPFPIMLAILINEMRNALVKRTIQSLLYIPHFISWVVMGGIAINLLSPSTGVINSILGLVGIEPIYFMTSAGWWPVVFIATGIWKGAGWGTIIYLAAISGIDPQLYEAAVIDGAGKLRQTWHITLPGIRSTIAILLILNVGGFLDLGFEQIWVLQNPAVRSVAEVIPTYVYRIGLQNMQFSYTAALGLFQSLVGLIMIYTANRIIRALGESGLW